jgi:hypothetical protein
MSDGEDFVMRPILRGMCRYESLRDGTLDLYDFQIMNEAIDVEEENEARARAAAERDLKRSM